MDSMVPNRAAAALTRPPRFRWFRSSTVNQWHTFALVSSAKTWTWSMVFPFRFSWTQRYTSSPWPKEALSVSTTKIFRPGYASRRSSAAVTADW